MRSTRAAASRCDDTRGIHATGVTTTENSSFVLAQTVPLPYGGQFGAARHVEQYQDEISLSGI